MKELESYIENGFYIKRNLLDKNICENIISHLNKIKTNMMIPHTNIQFGYGNIINTEIASIITDLDFVKDIGIKKIYPDKIEININEHKIVAVISNKENKYILSEEGHIIENYNDKFNSLPLIYGKNTENYFPYFYKLLNDINFNFNKIKYLKYFESNRWDIFLKDGKIIKLSSDESEIKESLANFMAVYSDIKFKQYKIFDFRVKNQLILK